MHMGSYTLICHPNMKSPLFLLVRELSSCNGSPVPLNTLVLSLTFLKNQWQVGLGMGHAPLFIWYWLKIVIILNIIKSFWFCIQRTKVKSQSSLLP